MTVSRHCREDGTAACADRYEAIAKDRFWYSEEAKGWLWTASANVVKPWKVCPWCGVSIGPPRKVDLENIRQADGADLYDGEDGP